MALRADLLRRAVGSIMPPGISAEQSRVPRAAVLRRKDRSAGELQRLRRLGSNSMRYGSLCLRRQIRAALSAAAQRRVHALPAQDSSTCFGRCRLPSSSPRARMRSNPSLNRTRNGRPRWPQSGVVHHPSRGQRTLPPRAG
jgi:hypothetical protein